MSPTLSLAKKTWHLKLDLEWYIIDETFKVMVFKGELDYEYPDKMVLTTWLVLINLNGN